MDTGGWVGLIGGVAAALVLLYNAVQAWRVRHAEQERKRRREQTDDCYRLLHKVEAQLDRHEKHMEDQDRRLTLAVEDEAECRAALEGAFVWMRRFRDDAERKGVGLRNLGQDPGPPLPELPERPRRRADHEFGLRTENQNTALLKEVDERLKKEAGEV